MEASGHRVGAVLATARWACSAVVLLILGSPVSPADSQNAPRRVLMLHAFNYTFPATTQVGEAARRRLLERSRQKIEIDADFLDLARISDPEHEKRMADFLRHKYARTPPDVVMTLGSAALPFIIKHRDAIGAGIPIVFTGISPQTYALIQPPRDVTGIITEFSLDKTLTLAESLQPDARRLFVIAGAGATDLRWQNVARRAIEGRQRAFETTYLFGLPYDELAAAVAQAPRDAIVILLTVFADGDGKAYVPAEVAASLAAISAAPVYAPYDTYLGNGTVGGYVETFESVGSAAADMVIEILDGKPAATLEPRTNRQQTYRVDDKALKRWNLREADLPAGTEILFRNPSLWQEHRGIVLGVLAAFCLQSVIVTVLLFQIRRRRHAEQSLRESEARFRSMADSAPVLICIAGTDRSCTFVNKSWLAFTGRTLRQELGEGWTECLHPDDAARSLETYATAFDARREFGMEFRLRRRDGEFRWLFHKGVPRHAPGGLFLGYIGIADDITDRRRAEEEAAEQRREVAHLMRVSVVGELSGAIAHEINQPLTAILTNAETGLDLLATSSPDLAELREMLQDIVQDNCRAAAVLQKLRRLLKKEERQFEAIDLNDLARSTLALLNSELIGRRICVRLDLASGLPATHGDPVQLQQVLLNLAMNAMDAMAGTPADERLLTVSTRAALTSSVELSISDRGPGIPASEHTRLFEPFYTTKDHGLGLGLPICSTLVKAHGGHIALVNGEGGGAVATLSFPVQELLIAAQ